MAADRSSDDVARNLAKLALWALLAIASSFATAQNNGLPRDAEMLAKFAEHRAEIEALVRSYREFDTANARMVWNDQPEVVRLRQKGGISRVTESGAIWLPEPYSAETGRRLDAVARSDGRTYFELSRRHGSLKIELSDPRYGVRSIVVDGKPASMVWKEYFFIPGEPRIERGRMLWPVDAHGQSTRSERVLSTLDENPPGWQRGECVFRFIESNWFIRMCWGA